MAARGGGGASSSSSRRGGGDGSEKILIARRYILGPRIGSGSFGEIFLCTDATREDKEYAVKLEPVRVQGCAVRIPRFECDCDGIDAAFASFDLTVCLIVNIYLIYYLCM